MLRAILHKEIEKSLENVYPGRSQRVDFSVWRSQFADYSANISGSYEMAEKISRDLMKSEMIRKYFLAEKIKAGDNGFLNFWLSERGLLGGLENLGKNFPGQKEKISLDYLDANPTGPVHLGHARSGFYGDVLANILKFYGHKISREFYVNNAKSSSQIQSLGKTALSIIGGGEGEEYRHEQLLEILKKPEVKKKLRKTKEPKEAGFYIAGLIQKENEEFLEKTVKIKFDLFFEEEKVYSSGMVAKILQKLRDAGVVYEKDGAAWLRSSQFGDSEDRVLIRSNGEPTYLLPDIGYHMNRLVKRKYDKAVNIFGADHYGYGPRLFAGLETIGIKPQRVKIIIAQVARLIKDGKELKMSKRAGVFVTLEELIKEVGLDAARFFFLMRSLDTHLDFDLDLAKERSKKNPVYYVQYAHARACSILKKSKLTARKSDFSFFGPAAGYLSKNKINAREEKSELSHRVLILKLIQFPEIIEDIAKDYQVHHLTTYAYELAKVFTDFYENVPVLAAETEELKKSRLALVSRAQKILERSLGLMGISAPEKM